MHQPQVCSDDEMTNQIWVNKEYSRKRKQYIGKPSMDNDLLKKNHYLRRNYRFTISKNISHSRMQTHEITHFITKSKLKLPNNKFNDELKKRW